MNILEIVTKLYTFEKKTSRICLGNFTAESDDKSNIKVTAVILIIIINNNFYASICPLVMITVSRNEEDRKIHRGFFFCCLLQMR